MPGTNTQIVSVTQDWQIFCFYKSSCIQQECRFIRHNKILFMATPNEISLLAGLLITGLFYLQLKKYEVQAKKEEMLDSFLKN